MKATKARGWLKLPASVFKPTGKTAASSSETSPGVVYPTIEKPGQTHWIAEVHVTGEEALPPGTEQIFHIPTYVLRGSANRLAAFRT